ncbi:MAG: hypothetical protein A2Z20_12380 [Bdellovibrionales bacterium RBG_16_40_8]|nr:MAG: hypothetical protein A2Z20_12380 [Bdellovibrionales bacterium RBG_16_40_8]
MPAKITAILSLLFATFFLNACEPPDSKVGPPKLTIPKAPPKQDQGEVKKTIACYLNSCFDTISVDQIEDPSGDYIYNDPNNFPNENLRNQYVRPLHLIDLLEINPATKVAPNFVLEDFMSEFKGRYALYSANVILKLQLMRNETKKPIYINSGYRNPAYNRDIAGSATWSRHMYGDAADFYIKDMAVKELPALCKKYGASFTLTYLQHIHCDWRESPLDPAFYTQTQLRADNVEKINFATFLQNQSKINFRQTDKNLIFSVYVPLPDEDEGVPTHEWSVILPTNEIITADTETFYAPKIHGTYQIKVVVGGSIVVRDNFSW